MAEERILTAHPEGKKGVNLSKEKYGGVKASILECLRGKTLTYSGLAQCVGKALRGRFEGSIRWYVEVVKLDLEARGTIERLKKTRPEKYSISI